MIDGMTFWNIILTLVVVPVGWPFNKMYGEIKRLQLVLADTREKFARRDDVKDDIDRIVQSLIRLEDKIDRVLSSKEK